ncbi:MAG: cytidine deaminase [Anaerolineae bacterium]|nr:cytidine deaminase [Anaerolineae bacterium]
MRPAVTQPDLPTLIRAASAAAEHAYVPYSHYKVGAALVTVSGEIFTGCNVENASFPAAICAERTALVKAVSEGHREFSQLVVVTRDGGAPCGVCRQMLFEFAPELPITLVRLDGAIVLESQLNDLLRYGFGPSSVLPSL